MARWDPGARERLVVAAVDLFTERGYDATTVAQIAERAGVTKSTFFRHFPDKRELLEAGQEKAVARLAHGTSQQTGRPGATPPDCDPLHAVTHAMGAPVPPNCTPHERTQPHHSPPQ